MKVTDFEREDEIRVRGVGVVLCKKCEGMREMADLTHIQVSRMRDQAYTDSKVIGQLSQSIAKWKLGCFALAATLALALASNLGLFR